MAGNLRCTACATPYAEAELLSVCSACEGVLVVDRQRAGPTTGDRAPSVQSGALPGLWRYAERIHAGHEGGIVTLGEGWTPVVALPRWGERIGLRRVFAKLEFFSPTGSFKDRGATVMVTRARELGARRLVEDSSGNAGASVAAYAARAGLACTIYAPAAAPEAKLAQIGAAGARLVRVPGPREAVAEAAMADTEGGAYYAGHNTNPYFVEGTRTFAFELAEQFALDPPEHLIMPVGGGSLYAGAWMGFEEWRREGLIARIPRMHIAQSRGCAPLVAAAEQGADDAVPVERAPTIAGGVTIERPARGRLILSTLRASGGSVAAVNDAAILAELRALGELEGLVCEPTSAVAFAALAHLARNGAIPPDERVVVAVTGSGLKDVAALAESVAGG
jgi:threonine synthase